MHREAAEDLTEGSSCGRLRWESDHSGLKNERVSYSKEVWLQDNLGLSEKDLFVCFVLIHGRSWDMS